MTPKAVTALPPPAPDTRQQPPKAMTSAISFTEVSFSLKKKSDITMIMDGAV